jgi:hypothetical protein
VTTVDIEAIRERAAHVTEALDRLVTAPNPGQAGQAHAAAVASATDVPLLLNELERVKAERNSLRERFDEARRTIAGLRVELHDARFGCEGAEHG